MNTKAQKIDSLFDDALNVRFGCVCFDFQVSDNGKQVPAPGSGWASVEGGSAFRIKSPADLASDVKWWTNLDRDIFWKSGAMKMPKLKKSEYFKTDLGDVMKELQMQPQNLTIATVCEYLSDMFNRVMRLAIELYDLKTFQEEDFTTELKNHFLPKDEPLDNHIDQALIRSYQDMVMCETGSINISGLRRIVLRRPRVIHARQVLETKVPLEGSQWEIKLKDELPADKDERLEYLINSPRPFICKVRINSFYDMDNAFVNLPKLLNMGEGVFPKGVRKIRDWMCQTELLYYSKFADIDIDAAMFAKEYDEHSFEESIVDLGPLSNLSYSYGLLAECVWNAYAERSRDPHTKSKTMVTPRASWLKSADRFLTLTSAMMLSSQGHQVVSYGSGMVVVQIPEADIKKLIENAPAASLTVPRWLVEKYQLSKELFYNN